MGTKIFILLCMVFCHIVDDYYLQGWLASAKQRSWWEKNAPDKLYKHDYLMALLMHCFSWSVMIMFPATIYIYFCGGTWRPILYLSNMVVHFLVEDLKANKRKINLIQDQTVHMIQIVLTWVWLLLIP